MIWKLLGWVMIIGAFVNPIAVAITPYVNGKEITVWMWIVGTVAMLVEIMFGACILIGEEADKKERQTK